MCPKKREKKVLVNRVWLKSLPWAVAWHSRGSCSTTMGLRMPQKAQVMHDNDHCPLTSTVFLVSP